MFELATNLNFLRTKTNRPFISFYSLHKLTLRATPSYEINHPREILSSVYKQHITLNWNSKNSPKIQEDTEISTTLWVQRETGTASLLRLGVGELLGGAWGAPGAVLRMPGGGPRATPSPLPLYFHGANRLVKNTPILSHG